MTNGVGWACRFKTGVAAVVEAGSLISGTQFPGHSQLDYMTEFTLRLRFRTWGRKISWILLMQHPLGTIISLHPPQPADSQPPQPADSQPPQELSPEL